MNWKVLAMAQNPAIKALVDEAKGISCQEWAVRQGWKMKKSGHNLAGPCPKCGGTDRFGIDTAGDKWICRSCGVGGHDAISMVQMLWPNLDGRSMKETFLEACEVITGRKRSDVVSEAEAERIREETERKQAARDAESARRREDARKSAYRVWRRAQGLGAHVEAYLEARGLGGADMDALRASKALREIPALDYWHDGAVRHTSPGMIAVIQWLDVRGTFGGVHRTWIDPNGKRGKAVIVHNGEALDAKKVLGSKGNGAIRLITPENASRMIVGEGIETTLTPWRHALEPDTAYWCAIDINHMAGRAGRDPETNKRNPMIPDMDDQKCLLVPSWVKEVIFLADESTDPKKVKQVNQCLSRAARRAKAINPNIICKAARPGNGDDFNALVMDE